MKSITIRNVPEETHRILRIRAAKNGRSLEAELRSVLGVVARLSAEPARSAQPANAGEEIRLTQKEHAIGAAQARAKVRRILEREAE